MRYSLTELLKSEQEYALEYKLLCIKEGHMPLHLTELPTRKLRKSAKRTQLREFLETRVDSIKTAELAKILNLSDDSIRRYCHTFVNEGWLQADKTRAGYTYKSHFQEQYAPD